jgi:hypothetical protein
MAVAVTRRRGGGWDERRTQVVGHMLYDHCRSFWHCGSSSLWSYLHWCHEL